MAGGLRGLGGHGACRRVFGVEPFFAPRTLPPSGSLLNPLPAGCAVPSLVRGIGERDEVEREGTRPEMCASCHRQCIGRVPQRSAARARVRALAGGRVCAFICARCRSRSFACSCVCVRDGFACICVCFPVVISISRGRRKESVSPSLKRDFSLCRVEHSLRRRSQVLKIDFTA